MMAEGTEVLINDGGERQLVEALAPGDTFFDQISGSRRKVVQVVCRRVEFGPAGAGAVDAGLRPVRLGECTVWKAGRQAETILSRDQQMLFDPYDDGSHGMPLHATAEDLLIRGSALPAELDQVRYFEFLTDEPGVLNANGHLLVTRAAVRLREASKAA